MDYSLFDTGPIDVPDVGTVGFQWLDGINNPQVPPSLSTGSLSAQSSELDHVFPVIHGPTAVAMPPAPPHGPHQLEQQFLPMQVPRPSVFQNQQQIMELQNKVTQLTIENRLLDTQVMMLFSAYNALLSRIHITLGINLGALDRTNYPEVKFWYMAEWTQFCSSRNVSTGREAGGANPQQPVMGAMQYIEDQHSHVVNGRSVITIRNYAQSIWSEFGISGAASTSWGGVDVESKKSYYRAMSIAFFELRLCDAHWKAEQIALDNYKLWHLRFCAQSGDKNTGHQSKQIRKPSGVGGPSKKSKGKSKALDHDNSAETQVKRMQAGVSNTAGRTS